MASRIAAGVELLGALEGVDRDLDIGVLEADRLGPLLAGRRRHRRRRTAARSAPVRPDLNG